MRFFFLLFSTKAEKSKIEKKMADADRSPFFLALRSKTLLL